MKFFNNRIQLPKKFQAAGLAAGIKKRGQKDLALLVSEIPAAVAGVFTTNQVCAATVKLCRERLRGRRARAVIVNSGIANACTGKRGVRDAREMARLVAREMGIPEPTVFVSSTGIIGKYLPMPLLRRGIPVLVKNRSARGGAIAAAAILTTDTRPKICTARFTVDGRTVTLAGMAKGAGMIEPNMATMLSYLLTDARVAPRALQSCLRAAVDQSFNRISVDGDRSTNDTVLLLANGAAGNRTLTPRHPGWPAFRAAVEKVCLDLALKIVRDGEGARRFITVQVRGARSDAEADLAARAVANSLLVKTSWAGTTPNWGRILDALGYSRARVVEDRVRLDYNGVAAVRRGVATAASVTALRRIVSGKEFTVTMDLRLGKGRATVYTCECTEEYVRINV